MSNPRERAQQPTPTGKTARRQVASHGSRQSALASMRILFRDEPELILAMLEGDEGAPPAHADLVLRAACEASASAPQNADLHYYAARAAWLAERLELAEQLLEQAVKSDANHVAALVLLGKVLHRRHAIDRAIACLTSAVRSGADYPDVHAELGHLWRKTGQSGRARDAYGRALQLNPNFKAAREAMTALATIESGC